MRRLHIFTIKVESLIKVHISFIFNNYIVYDHTSSHDQYKRLYVAGRPDEVTAKRRREETHARMLELL